MRRLHDDPLLLCQVLSEEYASLRQGLEFEHDEEHRDCIPGLHRLAHDKKFSALCLSGGGIRSATFSLGVIQGLAARGLLERLDYLSTVSGGGYIGSWLMAWIHRHRDGAPGVFKDLGGRTRKAQRTEPEVIRHLRSYSNYLSPRAGVFSADTWTLAALYLRNLLVLWLVLGPALGLLVMLPKLAALGLVPLARTDAFLAPWAGGAPPALALAFFFGTIATGYAALCQPSAKSFVRKGVAGFRRRLEEQDRFLWLCLVPMLCSAFSFVLYAAWAGQLKAPGSGWLGFGIAGALLLSIGWVLVAILSRVWTWPSARRLLGEIAVMTTTGFAIGALAWRILRTLENSSVAGLLTEPDSVASFGVPVLLACYLVTSIVVVGLMQYWINDFDREWWARLEAWVLIALVGWTLLCVLDLFAPKWDLGRLRLLLLTAIGGLSGILTLLIGWSYRSPANKAIERSGGGSWGKGLLVLVAPVFGAFVIVVISWLADVALRFLDTTPGWGVHLALVFGMFVVGLFASFFVDINKFSLHSMYRNRLIRAYLGASNENRKPNRFTGLDETDNIPINQMRGILLEREDIRDWEELRLSLMEDRNPVARFIRGNLSGEHAALLGRDPDPVTDEGGVVRALLQELNARLEDSDLTLDPPQRLRKGTIADQELVEQNRDELVRTFGRKQISVRLPRKPLHVINAALNLVGGEQLAWQERKAESFTVTAHHCGCCQLDEGRGSYRSSREYMKHPGVPITLGTAAAISGAAASPNMGYHSSQAVAFLMTLLNARLGWWAGNPGSAGAKTYDRAGPRFAIQRLIEEALGRTNDQAPYVYLSDGGHFDNLGLYEMVLRHCEFILVIDASSDPGYSLESLGNAIRKIRIDIGVPIELEGFTIYGRGEGQQHGSYCAIGSIRYGVVEGTEHKGHLIYIKPTIYFSKEPYDIYNYAKSSKDFPHEPTSDQWFSEAQFESYRMLGLHIVDTICDRAVIAERSDSDFEAWTKFHHCVEGHVGKLRGDFLK